MNQRIIYQNAEGGVSVIIPAPECGLTIDEIAAKDVPQGAAFEIVTTDDIPADRTFRNAWKQSGKKVEVDLPKAKLIAHDRRRAMREEEFAPHDAIIAKQIPGKDAQAAEAARSAIRDKYAAMQTAIDAAADAEAIKSALGI